MNKKTDLIGIIGLLLAVFTLLFGDNIYERITGHPIFQNSPPLIAKAPTDIQVEPTGIPISISTSTTDLPIEITDTKGVQMMLVPAGEFKMGSDAGKDHEKPVHTVFLDAFYMDKFEVTNMLYKACEDVGVCLPPKESSSSTRSSYYGNSEFDNFPVIDVDWNMAKTYCEWRGARLPTEAEWEKAARGIDGRTYPWGAATDCSKLNYYPCTLYGDTNIVGSHEQGKSPYGINDMAGNVWEWVADWYDENYYKISPSTNPTGPQSGQYRVSRGGSWTEDASRVRSAARVFDEPTRWNYYSGFRCAEDANP